MRQKPVWSYFVFSQTQLPEGKIASAMLLPHEAKQTLPFFSISKFIESVKSEHN